MRITATSAGVAAHFAWQHDRPHVWDGLYSTLNSLPTQGAAETGEAERPSAPDREPAVAIEKSVFQDYIICLEDGKKMKTLR